MKNIVFVCKMDFASVSARLTEAINEHRDWNAHCVVESLTKYSIMTPNTYIANDDNESIIRQFLDEATVVIWGSGVVWLPYNYELDEGVLVGIWHGGRNYRSQHQRYIETIHNHLDFVFAHRDLESLDERTIRLQAPYEPTLKPNRSGNKIYIGHSPSNPDLKGTHYYLEAIAILKAIYPGMIVSELMVDLTNDEVLKVKTTLDIFFDQIGNYYIPENATRGYGMSLIESASMGSVCLSWSDYPDTPIIHVENADDIVRSVIALIENPELLNERGNETLAWFEQEHGYKSVSQEFIRYLDSIVEELNEIS